METLNRIESIVLAGMVRDLRYWRNWLKRWEAADFRQRPSRRYVARECRRGELARDERIVMMDLSGWLGKPPTASEKVLASRAYAALEGKGLIQRLTFEGSNVTSQIRVLPAGERAAAKPRSKPRPAAPITVAVESEGIPDAGNQAEATPESTVTA